tara:strand:- start:221 stop:1333 length:1113 start_codon:yes stop_codon:yes gene_type:complete
MKQITHLTIVHRRYDSRIFYKQCTSLAKNEDYCINLVVADCNGDEIKNNVYIYDIGIKYKSRLRRIFHGRQKILQKAINLNSDIYHIHDPELIPVGLKLKKLGKKIIFDSHEDVSEDIMLKNWIPFLIRKIISILYVFFEKYTLKKFDFLISPTEFINDKLKKINPSIAIICNYPIVEDFDYNEEIWKEKNNEIVYVGGISILRGIEQMINYISAEKKVTLNLAGDFYDKKSEEIVKTFTGKNLKYKGFIDKSELFKIINTSKIGLSILHPTKTYIHSLPIKLFEYMLLGLPVIVSNFHLFESIVIKNKCGISVNPLDDTEIRDSINYIMKNPKIAAEMGANGRKAVLNRYNWGVEEKKLLSLYDSLIHN